MLLDRIPAHNNLWKRHAIAPEASRECVFCGTDEESSIHLFLHCYVAQLWDKIVRWIGGEFITPPNHLFKLNV